MSAADRATYARAKQNGTTFNSRASAVSSFRQRYGSQYKTSGWASEPSTRPSYIPRSYSYNGRQVNIIFHNGGYGYYDPFHPGVWMAYDLWHDQMAMNQMMANQGYYYGPTPVVQQHGFGHYLFWILMIGIILLVLYKIFGPRQSTSTSVSSSSSSNRPSIDGF